MRNPTSGRLVYTLRLGLALLAVGACGASYPAMAATYYVADPKGPDAVAGTADDADASDAYPGTQAKPFATLGRGAAVAVAGDTVLIRGGVYQEILRPANSGAAGSPITFQAFPGELVTIRDTPGLTNLTADEAAADQAGRQYGIYVYGRSYVTLAGLNVTSVMGWARIVNSNHIVIRDGNFTNATATGTTGSIKFVQSHDNIVRNNVIDGGNDNLLLIHSDRNLVEGNRITSGRHTLWCIRAANFNVIRDNYFYNALQKIGEVYDAETDPPIQYDCTKHNLIEGNVFAYTPSSGSASPYAAIQYAGQEGIIRQNVFYSTVGPALDLTLYSNEARYNTHNRVYNNDFYATSFAGLSMAGSTSYSFLDNIIKNNILTKSIFVANDTRWTWYTQTLAGKPVQVLTSRLDGFVLENNNLFNAASGEAYLITYGDRTSSSNPPGQSVSWWQTNYPALFRGNLEADPQYVDEAGKDFHLKAGSPMIDAGAFLTKTVGAGSGTVLAVADARYFFDGFGMTGEDGQPVLRDLIQLEGDTRTARVVAIDYAANTLTLDQVLTWTDGQGVALRYSGTRPDVGAYEYTSGANQRPVASFTVSFRADQPMTADFDASGSSDPDGQIVRYDWDFGNGQTLANAPAKVAHTFAATGQYTVKLTVTDNGTPGLTNTATVPVNVTVVSRPLRVVGVTLNQRLGRSVSAIEPSGIGVRTIEVVFNKPATFDASAVQLETVRFEAGMEVVTGILAPVRLTGSHTNVMTLTFDNASVVDTWVKVTLFGDETLRDEEGQALDGEPLRGTAGPGYIASAALDLPSGDGTPGGDAVFYVGSLRGDLTGDGRVTPEDIAAFFQKHSAGDSDADFRGLGFGDNLPDGKITPTDIDGFLSIYQAAVASGSDLDPLPGVSYP